jgi:hypothetical protein
MTWFRVAEPEELLGHKHAAEQFSARKADHRFGGHHT